MGRWGSLLPGYVTVKGIPAGRFKAMKTIPRAILAVITALVSCGACLSQQVQKSSQQPTGSTTQTAPELQSPAKASQVATAFDVGKFPIGVVSDGTNIWVANGGSNTVTKLRASDGAVLETFTVGTLPLQVAFDGANIWVTNGRSASVSKLKK